MNDEFNQDGQTVDLHGGGATAKSGNVNASTISGEYNKQMQDIDSTNAQPQTQNVSTARPVNFNQGNPYAAQNVAPPNASYQQSPNSANMNQPSMQPGGSNMGVPIGPSGPSASKGLGIDFGIISLVSSILVIPGIIFGVLDLVKKHSAQQPVKKMAFGIAGIIVSLVLGIMYVSLLSGTNETSTFQTQTEGFNVAVDTNLNSEIIENNNSVQISSSAEQNVIIEKVTANREEPMTGEEVDQFIGLINEQLYDVFQATNNPSAVYQMVEEGSLDPLTNLKSSKVYEVSVKVNGRELRGLYTVAASGSDIYALLATTNVSDFEGQKDSLLQTLNSVTLE